MPENIRIRNLSNKHIRLVLAEHFAPANDGSFQISNFTRKFINVTNKIGLTNSLTRQNVPQIDANAQPFQAQELSIEIPEFGLVQTDVNPLAQTEQDRLRLTFEVDGGQQHRMYCPVPTLESHSLEILGDNSDVRFTGIYLPDTSFVALYETHDLDRWMDILHDSIPLGALSIPGTHNSPTCHNAPPSVRCQAVSPREQLNNGVRFFDIRVQVPEPFDINSDKLVLVHSVFPISLTGSKLFRDLVDECRRFLDEHPSETIVMSLKREGSGNGTDEQFSQILRQHYANSDQWWTEPRIPVLGESRNRIVLVRRFNLGESLHGEWNGAGWGIDGSSWADNTPSAMCASGDICVQDYYEVLENPSIDQKIIYAREQLERSGCCSFDLGNPGQRYPIYINFLSASNFWNVGMWPEKIAARVNPAITAHLCEQHMLNDDGSLKEGDWSTGIVVCDWVGLDGDWDVVRCIVGMNTKLPKR